MVAIKAAGTWHDQAKLASQEDIFTNGYIQAVCVSAFSQTP